MKKIGIISDTHGFWDEAYKRYFSECDEIWHAGDIGHLKITDELQKIAPLKAVFGNIDNNEIRQEFKEDEIFDYGNQKVLITHIAGKLSSYYQNCKEKIVLTKPNILVCGHSHICKVAYDKKYQLLYINPGAAGIIGFHKVRTIIRLDLKEDIVENLEVIELKNRRKLS
ncbi:metallophosphatase family protein [bacterium]|jgi:uncharacterized protein|nr:metallophosphatase family protein [bacterium]